MTSSNGKPRTREAARQRPGRQFEPRAERTLLALARHVISELDGAEQGVLALKEMHAPFGVPDLTVVVGDSAARRSRLRLPVPPLLNEIDAGVTAVASHTVPRTAERLAASLGWPISTLERRIPRLLRNKALREVMPGQFLRRSALKPIGTIVAVELKVDDWKRALTQGRTYRTWADSYVLIIDSVPQKSLPHLVDAVQNDRGGLVAAGRWIVKPKSSTRTPARRLWASEHVIAASRRATPNLPPRHTS
jgi:hypothetical protein